MGTGAGARPSQSSGAAVLGLPGTAKFGAWVHTGRFADQRFDAQGGSLASSGGPPLQHAGNFGVAFGRTSPRAAAYDRDVAALSGTRLPIRDFEAAIELTYQVQIADGWSVQPNIQHIVHPGGNVTDQLDPSGHSPIRDATVLGVRTMLSF